MPDLERTWCFPWGCKPHSPQRRPWPQSQVPPEVPSFSLTEYDPTKRMLQVCWASLGAKTKAKQKWDKNGSSFFVKLERRHQEVSIMAKNSFLLLLSWLRIQGPIVTILVGSLKGTFPSTWIEYLHHVTLFHKRPIGIVEGSEEATLIR